MFSIRMSLVALLGLCMGLTTASKLQDGIQCVDAGTKSPTTWTVLPVDSLVRVFPDGTTGGAAEFPGVPSISAMGGQEVAVQLVIQRSANSQKKPDLVRSVAVSDPASDATPLVAAASWYVVGYVNVQNPSNQQNRTGWFPDPLTPIFTGYTSITNNTAFESIESPHVAWPLWVRIKMANVASKQIGSIILSLTFNQDDGTEIECSTKQQPTRVVVVPHPTKAAAVSGGARAIDSALTSGPEQRGLHQITDCHVQGAALELAEPGAFHGNITGTFLNAVSAMSTHGINSLEYQGDWRPDVNVTLVGGDCASLNPVYIIHEDAYLAMMREVLATSDIRRFRLPLPTWVQQQESHFATVNDTWTVHANGAPQQECKLPILKTSQDGTVSFHSVYEAHWKSLATSLWKVLQEQPWFSSVTYSHFVIDEPEWNDNTTAQGVLLMMKQATENLPGIKIWQDRWPVPPQMPADPAIATELARIVDTWCVHVLQWSTPGVPLQLAALRAAGKTITIYDNGMLFVDLPWSRIRTQAWMVWRSDSGVDEAWNGVKAGSGLRGTLSWYDATSWRDPHGKYANPWHGLPLYHNISGFGVQLYPPLRADSLPSSTSSEAVGMAILPSIRHEHLWLGIQDAEAFYLLQEAEALPREQFIREQSEEAVAVASTVPDEVLQSVWNFTVEWSLQHLLPPIPNDGYTINVTLIREAQRKSIEALGTAAA